jgi:peptidoglycan hydrolase CwlO-like protein
MRISIAKSLKSKKRQLAWLLAVFAFFAAIILPQRTTFAEDCKGESGDGLRRCELRNETAELNQEIKNLQEEASRLHTQADSLQKEIAILKNEQDTLRKQIELKQAEHDRIVLEIESTQKRIDDNNEAIGYAIAQYYYSGEVSTIERIASAQSFSSFLDQEVNLSSLSDTLFAIVEENKALKTELVAKKNEAERIMHDLEDQKALLAKKQEEQAALLAQTQSDEEGYNKRKKEQEAKRAEKEKELAELSRSLSNNGLSAGDPSKGGYPHRGVCPEKQDWYADSWGMYICECVSYAAWKVDQYYGNMPYWGGSGNANQWPTNAYKVGIPVLYSPKANTVGIMLSGYYGHAVWIEAVSDDGSQVYISQYNAWNAATNYTWGEYSEQWAPASSFVYLDFGAWNR